MCVGVLTAPELLAVVLPSTLTSVQCCTVYSTLAQPPTLPSPHLSSQLDLDWSFQLKNGVPRVTRQSLIPGGSVEVSHENLFGNSESASVSLSASDWRNPSADLGFSFSYSEPFFKPLTTRNLQVRRDGGPWERQREGGGARVRGGIGTGRGIGMAGYVQFGCWTLYRYRYPYIL